jgi:hypothetical protein
MVGRPSAKNCLLLDTPPRATAKGFVLTERLQTIFYFFKKPLKNMLPFQNV